METFIYSFSNTFKFLFFKTKHNLSNLSSKHFPSPFKGVFSCNAACIKSHCIII